MSIVINYVIVLNCFVVFSAPHIKCIVHYVLVK